MTCHRLQAKGVCRTMCGEAVPNSVTVRPDAVWYIDDNGSAGDCFDCEAINFTMYRNAAIEDLKKKSWVLPSAELQCPRCNRYHVDREEWYHKPHHTHLCEFCHHEWYLSEAIRGIEPVSLRGRARALKHALADTMYLLITPNR